MKKIRTASVRATTAEIEAEQNEKRQRNNSPRLTIVKIVLTHQTESNFTFKNTVCEQYNIENTTDDRDVFEMYAKNFYKILDKDEFIVPDKGKKKGISVKLAKSGLVKHNDQITLTPEEAANKLEVHSSKNILEGIVIGGIYGRPRNARQLKNRNKKKDVNRDDVITDDYYVMIYLPMDNNIGFLLLQYYPDITIKDEITKFIRKTLRRSRAKYDIAFSYYCSKEMSEQFSSNSILDHLTLTNPFINGDAINDKEDVENKQVNDIILKVEVASPSDKPVPYSQIQGFIKKVANVILNNKAAKDYQMQTATIRNQVTGLTTTFDIDGELKIRPTTYLYKKINVNEDGIPNFAELKEYCFNELENIRSETLAGYKDNETKE